MRGLCWVPLLFCACRALAQDDDFARCTTLSFAPLDETVPACNAMIDDPAGLDPAALASIHAARAEALEFALVYHGENEVDPDALLAAALADLEQAVSIDPRHHAQRASILFRLGRFPEAADGFTAAIAASPADAAGLLESRSVALAAAGDMVGAIDDMTAAVRLSTAAPDLAHLLGRRAELKEQTGDVAGAIADHTAILRILPDRAVSQEALVRLGGGPPG